MDLRKEDEGEKMDHTVLTIYLYCMLAFTSFHFSFPSSFPILDKQSVTFYWNREI